MPDMHPCEKRFQDVGDVKTDLAQLLKKVQMHKCTRGGTCQRVEKKSKKTVCRFHFPFDICHKSTIAMKDGTVEYEFVPERNDQNLNKFNPFIIGTWRANIDIAPVLSKRAIIEYLSKYVSKSEVGSVALKEICSAVCDALDSNDKCKRAIHKILMKNCVERDVSAQEVCHILMGQKLYSAGGRNFVIVYTKSSDWVPVPLNESGNSEHCETLKGKCFMEKYGDRPDHLHSLSMWDVAKYYNERNWKKSRKPNIVRVFPRLTLSDIAEKNEEFYRQKVLLFVPWRNDTILKNDNETWRDVYDRCGLAQLNTAEVEINIGQVENPYEDVSEDGNPDQINEDWMIASRLCAQRGAEEIELGRREVDVQHNWHSHLAKYDQYGSMSYFQSYIENEKQKAESEGNSCNDLPNVEFSDEQKAVKTLMEKQIEFLESGSGHVPKRVLVQGKAGTGKSLLIKYLINELIKKFGTGSFLLLGPTGVSAINIGGSTIHSALKLPIKSGSFKDLKGETARKFCDMIENVKFVIIDEYSMIGCGLLGMIDKRLREGTGVNEPFGSLFVYFFGDCKQLPPVKDVALYGSNCKKTALVQHGRNVFDSFQSFFELKQCHRQKDKMFQEVLDRLSNGEVTLEDYNLLRTRFTTTVNFQEQKKFDDAIRLFSTKEAVESYNKFKLHSLKDENGNMLPVARVPAKHNGRGASAGSVDKVDGLASVLYLARGSRIMLRTNLWVQRGLVNGSVGTVVDLLYHEGKEPPNDAPVVVMCKFDSYTGIGIGPENLVPVVAIVRSWTSPSGVQCSRQQFPLVLCYACSIHKSQGLTMDQAVIDVGPREFSLGLSYVAMSRVKSLDGLLLKPFTFERLQVIKRKPEIVLRKRLELIIKNHCQNGK